MFKVSSSEIVKITKALERAAFAINTLERLGQNKIVFLEIKIKLLFFYGAIYCINSLAIIRSLLKRGTLFCPPNFPCALI